MTHEEALNLILANTCGQMNANDQKLYREQYMERYGISSGDMDKDLILIELDLHCATAEVVAELISTVNTIQYRIISVRIK